MFISDKRHCIFNPSYCLLLTVLFSAYSVSKIGVIALSMVQAREFKADQREGILVNAVSIDMLVI